MYVIPDADVWAGFLTQTLPPGHDAEFQALLESGDILVAPIVIQKSFGKKASELMRRLPQAPSIEKKYLDAFIQEKNLTKFDSSAYQIELLATALMSQAKVWSSDRLMRTISTVFAACYFEKD